MMTRARQDRNAIEKIEWMRNLLAFLLVGSFVGSLTILLFLPLAKVNEQLVTYMLGQISGMATTALGFYFVSKVGQDALDATRSENTGKLADAIKETAKVAQGGGSVESESAIHAGDAVKIEKAEGDV